MEMELNNYIVTGCEFHVTSYELKKVDLKYGKPVTRNPQHETVRINHLIIYKGGFMYLISTMG